MTRRALVLSSGGARGSFQVGALEEFILNRNLDFHVFCGISVGALNATLLAQARFDQDQTISVANLKEAFRTLRDIWLKSIVGNQSIYHKRTLGVAGIPLGANSIYDVRPLGDLLRRYVKPQELAQSNRDLRIQYVVLETGELVTIRSADPEIVNGVLASATVPFFFPPVGLGEKHLVDGGVRDSTPLATAFESEPPPDEIYVIYASPADLDSEEYTDSSLGFKLNATHYLMRSVEILLNEIDLTDVSGARRFNTLKEHWEKIKHLLPSDHLSVKEIDTVLEPIRYAKIVECRPEKLIIKDGLNFSPTEIRENYEHGKAVAAKHPR